MDDLYNKMVLALPDDFFNGWELEDGDQVYLFKDTDDYTCSEKHGLYTIFDNLLANDGVTYTENWHYATWMISDGLIRPIPSQKQLQCLIRSLLKFHNVELNDLEILNRVVGRHNRRDPENKQNKSTDCLFLEVHMWLNNKTWNGEAWI